MSAESAAYSYNHDCLSYFATLLITYCDPLLILWSFYVLEYFVGGLAHGSMLHAS